MKYVLVGLWCSLIFCGMANAHDMIPTYPKFTNTFVTGVLKTKMEIFNKREDVSYYELGAFDAEWNVITNLSSLVAGDVVRFTVSGKTNSGAIDKARFTINGTLKPEVTAKDQVLMNSTMNTQFPKTHLHLL